MQGVSEARGQRRNEAALLGLHTCAASGLAPQAPQHVQPGTRLPERRRTRGWIGWGIVDISDGRHLLQNTRSLSEQPTTTETVTIAVVLGATIMTEMITVRRRHQQGRQTFTQMT